MGLFDQIAGQVLGGLGGGGSPAPSAAAGGQSPVLQLVQALLQSQGGLEGLLAKLNAGGLSQQASSWVGTGENLPVGADQIREAVGGDLLSSLANQFGVAPEQASEGLANYLPGLIDKLTPNGRLEGNDQLLQQGLSALGGLFGNSR